MAKLDTTYAGRQALASNSTVLSSTMIAGYRVRVSASDPVDGNFASNLTDPLTLTVDAKADSVQQQFAITLKPSATAVSSLASAIHAGGTLSISSSTLRSNAEVGANTKVTSTSAIVDAPTYSAGEVTGSTYSQGSSIIPAPLTMPNASDVVAAYTAMGTTIPRSSLSSNTLSNCLLSPASNPFGSTNANGIYVIDCQSQNIVIRDMRLVGTLVLLNAGPATTITGSVSMERAASDTPVLIVEGTLNVVSSGSELSETTTNFNPASTPYRGTSNTTANDKYANEIVGIVYVRGKVSLAGVVTIVGQVLASSDIAIVDRTFASLGLSTQGISVSASGSASRNDVAVYFTPIVTPPAAFTDGTLRIVQDSPVQLVQ